MYNSKLDVSGSVHMLEFLVLGLIPGTNIQINFGIVADTMTAIAVVAATPRLLRYAESRRQLKN